MSIKINPNADKRKKRLIESYKEKEDQQEKSDSEST